MIYADYAWYRDEYRGCLPEMDFDRLSRRASARLDAITFGRIRGPWLEDERVKNACCALVDEFQRQEKGGRLASETVGKWSRTYVSSTDTPAERLYTTAAEYLVMTGLLYRGVNT